MNIINKPDYFVGIDAGKEGAICMTDAEGNLLMMIDMPMSGHNVDIRKLYRIFEKFKNKKIFITVEQMFAGFSVVHKNYIWQQAENFRTIICAIYHVNLETSYTIVMPRSWQARFIDGCADKNKSIKTAIEMTGRNDIFTDNKDGRAEAFLICEFGREMKNKLYNNKQEK